MLASLATDRLRGKGFFNLTNTTSKQTEPQPKPKEQSNQISIPLDIIYNPNPRLVQTYKDARAYEHWIEKDIRPEYLNEARIFSARGPQRSQSNTTYSDSTGNRLDPRNIATSFDKLHQIIEFYIQPPNQMLYTDTVIRAISELHKIEISIFSLWKQIPDLPILVNGKNQQFNSTTLEEPRPTTYPTIRDPNDPKKYVILTG